MIEKYGQLPSVADIAQGELKEYGNLADPEDMRELRRAVGLAASGIGIGSFVYLRRIFERLVNAAADEAKVADPSFDREAFRRLRMEDKLGEVKAYIPEWMVQNRKLYGVISVGIHELTEEHCKAVFPVVKDAVLALIEQHAEKKKRERRARDAAAALNRLEHPPRP